MAGYESLIGRAILTSDPAERQACEDVITLRLHASRNLRDWRSIVVLEAPNYAASVIPTADWDELSVREDVKAELDRIGARVIDGRAFTAAGTLRKRPVSRG